DGHPDVGLGHGFAQRDGNAVGFFARRGGRAPDGNRLAAGTDEARKNLEVVLLTEKGRVVDGERVDENLPLRRMRVAGKIVEVVAHTGMADLMRSERKRAAGHFLFVLAQNDSGAALKKPRRVLEVAWCQA